MPNIKAYLLQDPETGILWMHGYSYDQLYYLETPNGVIDFANFNEIVGEFISYRNYGLCMASYDICVVKNKAGLYTVLCPYKDSGGFGAIYASICKGFPFKEVYGFGHMFEDYILAKNTERKWGMYRISIANPVWNNYEGHEAFCIPQVIVRFENDTMDEALAVSGITLSPSEMFYLKGCSEGRTPGDLTTKMDDYNESWGVSLKEIQQARKCNICERIPQRKDELFEDMRKYKSKLLAGIEISTVVMIARYLATPSLISHFAQLFNIENEFLLNQEMMARIILSEFKKN